MLSELDAVAPGASGFLHAVRYGHFVSMSRFHVYAATFAAMQYVLSDLQGRLALD